MFYKPFLNDKWIQHSDKSRKWDFYVEILEYRDDNYFTHWDMTVENLYHNLDLFDRRKINQSEIFTEACSKCFFHIYKTFGYFHIYKTFGYQVIFFVFFWKKIAYIFLKEDLAQRRFYNFDLKILFFYTWKKSALQAILETIRIT